MVLPILVASLAVVHPEVKVTPGRFMVAMVQVARDPDAACVLAGYDPIPEDPERQTVIRTSRARAAYARADWIDAESYDPETRTSLTVG